MESANSCWEGELAKGARDQTLAERMTVDVQPSPECTGGGRR
jgi:hypothetical protein